MIEALAALKSSDWIIAISTLLGPILAVQAQKVLERATENRRYKLQIFNILMATRATRVAPDHVQALNRIDLTFSGRKFFGLIDWQNSLEKEVINSWRNYHDKLNERVQDESNQAAVNAWIEKSDDLFIDLLQAIAKSLRFKFNRVQLKRGIYYPRAHSDGESRQEAIQQNLFRILSGNQALRMDVAGFPLSQVSIDAQQAFQKSVVDGQQSLQKAFASVIAPDGSIRVTAKNEFESK